MPNPTLEGVNEPGFFTVSVNPPGLDVQAKEIGLLNVMLQLFINPVSTGSLSDTNNFHVPLGFTPLKELNAAEAVEAVSGLNVPVNGEEVRAVVDDELNTVFVKFAPKPLRFDNVRYLPSGATSRIIKSPSYVCVRLLIFTLAICPLVRLFEFIPDTTIDDVAIPIPEATVLSGIATGVEFVKVKLVVVVPVELKITVEPWQTTVSEITAVTVMLAGWVTVAESFAEQLFASVTVTVYVPAERLDAVEVS